MKIGARYAFMTHCMRLGRHTSQYPAKQHFHLGHSNAIIFGLVRVQHHDQAVGFLVPDKPLGILDISNLSAAVDGSSMACLGPCSPRWKPGC